MINENMMSKKIEAFIVLFILLIGCSPATLPDDAPLAEPPSHSVSENAKDDLRFIVANPLDLSQIQRMSIFRSCIGHDYSGLNIEGEEETLRSMKHYLEPLPALVGTDQIKIFAPFDGKVTEILDGPPGQAIYISAKAAPSWKFIFFHVIPAAGIEEGTLVQAGELVGTVSTEIHNFDFALKEFGWKGQVFDSPLLHMKETVLQEYVDNGITLENSILSKETRDAEPCPIEGTRNGDALFTGYRDEDFVTLRRVLRPEQENVIPPPENEQSLISDGNQAPVLHNVGVTINHWDKRTNLAGDFRFENKNYVDNKIFTEFGHTIVNDMGEKRLPEIGFNVPVGTKVVSPIDGIITEVKLYEPSQDYLISMKTDESSPWIVGFEHVYNVRLKAGDTVLVGQEIAQVSPSYGRTEFGNVEINVWIGGESIIKYCPFEFLDESLKPMYEEKIKGLAKDWEEFIGEDVYRQEEWVAPGCLLHNLTER